LAHRLALLTFPLLLGLAGCLRSPAATRAPDGCGSCHPPHYVAQGGCHGCHRGEPSARRLELAHQGLLTGRAAEHPLRHGPAVSEGTRLAEQAACRRCHTIDGTGNRLAADLDRTVWRRTQAQLTASILEPVENMPRFGFDRAQAEALIAYLLSRGDPRAPLEAYRVTFSAAGPAPRGVFEEKCGGCHRFLGPSGPVGRGSQGPNLSGLFTRFYPKTAAGERPWTAEALKEWLANPRKVRPATTMPPVALTPEELQRVTEQLGVAGP
jgi:mono/diheme cytochrome c family protein